MVMRTNVKNKIILALGSNTDQEMNMMKVEQLLKDLFGEVAFSTQLWTMPIGLTSEKFINCLAFIKTTHGLPQVSRAIKQLERKCGNTKAERSKGLIKMDIDILKFNDTIFHEDDWERNYIKTLMKQDPFDI